MHHRNFVQKKKKKRISSSVFGEIKKTPKTYLPHLFYKKMARETILFFSLMICQHFKFLAFLRPCCFLPSGKGDSFIEPYNKSTVIHLQFWVYGSCTRCFPYQGVQLQTYESRTLFLLTSLQYYCILGLAEIKTLHPRDKIMCKRCRMRR